MPAKSSYQEQVDDTKKKIALIGKYLYDIYVGIS